MTIEQNTPEWLEFRKNHIGASDAPIILKQSPWKTPYRLWQEKVSLAESETNAVMQRGHEMEAIARAALEDKLGMPLGPKIKLHSQRSWMMASLDAVSFDECTVAEIKCPGKADHEIALSGQVPEKYVAQLQHQIEVGSVEMVYYFSYYQGDGVLLKEYRRGDYIKNLISEEEKFLECMNSFEPPELIDRDFVQHEDDHWYQLAERLKIIKELIAEEDVIKKALITMADGKNSMGAGVKVSKCFRKGTIDYKVIPELQGLNLDVYRKKNIEYWRVS